MKNLNFFISTMLFLICSLNLVAQTNDLFDNSPRRFKAHRTSVNDLEFNNDGSLLYSCGGKNQVSVIDLQTGEVIRSTEPQGFELPINEISLNFDNTLLAYGGFNQNRVVICDAVSFEVKREIRDFIMLDDICFAPKSNLLAIVGTSKETNNQIIVIYNAENGNILQKITSITNKDFTVSVSFSADGKYLASGVCNANQGVRIYDVETGQLVKTILINEDIYPVQFSPDGKYVAGGSGDNNAYIWEVSSGNLIHTLSGSNDAVLALDYSPDGKTIAGGGFDYSCSFKLWDTETGKLIQSVGSQNNPVQAITFHPAGNKVAVSYVTYGDFFDVPTINLFFTENAILENKWHEINSEKSGLIVEFPEAVTEEASGDNYYEYYDYTLSLPGVVYQIRATKYLYKIDENKRQTTIENDAEKFESERTQITGKTFTINGFPAYEGTGFDGTLRTHYLVAFINNVNYSIKYIDYKTEENSSEKRFFSSFKVR